MQINNFLLYHEAISYTILEKTVGFALPTLQDVNTFLSQPTLN
ncbi:hypothetical protein [Dactylococcopsis salina]|uniref:Uncharacterized protein n=1 Tax=Dactylococcopsis salina (strain PCC 8305) TaxID=13035 RepID=K9YV38_DACS8|nr:hypothetical protein [Dactylococcopsis salina]AFZ50754.1 hypothetical protein Dacsa_2121 [Dactylococcopsis salina PCC 8305]